MTAKNHTAPKLPKKRTLRAVTDKFKVKCLSVRFKGMFLKEI